MNLDLKIASIFLLHPFRQRGKAWIKYLISRLYLVRLMFPKSRSFVPIHLVFTDKMHKLSLYSFVFLPMTFMKTSNLYSANVQMTESWE